MLVPYVVYNDVLTGKESPAALFFVMAYAGVYGWCAHGSVRGLVVALTGWSVLAWIRPPGALIFLGVVFVVLALNLPPARRRWTVVVGLVLVSGGTVGLSLIENVTESRSLNTMSLAWTMLTAEGELDKFHALEWADRSLGRQLLPETAWQAVASTPVRAALYWISPLAA